VRADLDQAVGAVLGLDVTLREARPGQWLAVPRDRALLRSQIWQRLRNGPRAGIGSSPTEAALLLALASGGLPRPKPPSKQAQARSWLASLLGDGQPRMVAEVKELAQAQGITWPACDRSARSLDVLREKLGLRGPWVWTLLPDQQLQPSNSAKPDALNSLCEDDFPQTLGRVS
jgi:hypothetical protein